MATTKEMRSKLELWRYYFLEVGSSMNDFLEKLALAKKPKKNLSVPLHLQEEFQEKQKAVEEILQKLEQFDTKLAASDVDAPLSEEMTLKINSLIQILDNFQTQYNSLKKEFYDMLKLQ